MAGAAVALLALLLLGSPVEMDARFFRFSRPSLVGLPHSLVVHLEDGRSLSVPLEWFPRLRDATPAARNRWELMGRGLGIHWPELDEDLSVAGLLGLPD